MSNPITVTVTEAGVISGTTITVSQANIVAGGSVAVTVSNSPIAAGAGKTIVSAGGIANLTQAQQDAIGEGTIVVTTDGFRYIYSGGGSKTSPASYIILADITPDWAALSGKPATFPPSSHAAAHGAAGADPVTVAIAQVTGLQTALDGKQAAGSYAAAVHTHGISDVTGLQTALDGKAAATHTHTIGNVTGLQAALDGKQAAGSYAAAVHTHAIADVSFLQGQLDARVNAAVPFTANHTAARGSQYQIGDLVEIGGNVFRAIANNDSIVPDVNSAVSANYWALVGAGYRLNIDILDIANYWLPPTGADDGDVIAWDATAGGWEAVAIPTLPSGAAGEILVHNGTEWVAQAAATASATVLGGVKIGSGVTITDGVISVSTDYAAATHTHGSADIADFTTAAAAAAPVQSVAGQTGAVTLAKADVGLGNVDNTSDLDKPVSSATQQALDAKAASSHFHSWSEITSGTPTTLSGYGITDAVSSSDGRLSDARTPTSHTHGNLTDAGAIGTTSGLPIITTTAGVLTAGAFGSTPGTFCQGNDARLSNARTPTAHTHAAADITSGTVATARLGSGTAGAYTWLAGDSAWKTFAFLPGFSGFADADDWASRVTTNGGSVSAATMTAVYQFCLAIAAAGIRDRFFRLNLFAGTGLASALVPLYRGPTRTGTQHGNTTDTNANFVSGDYVETGSTGGLQGLRTATKRLETGVSPSTFSGFNFHTSAYEIVGSDTTYDNTIGAWATASNAGFSMGTSDLTTKYECSVVNNAIQLTQTAIAGHYIFSQTGNRVGLMIGSGGQITTAYVGGANLISDWSAATWGISVFALQSAAGTFVNYSSSRLGGYSIGLSLTAAQAAAFYAAMEQFQAAMGRKP